MTSLRYKLMLQGSRHMMDFFQEVVVEDEIFELEDDLGVAEVVVELIWVVNPEAFAITAEQKVTLYDFAWKYDELAQLYTQERKQQSKKIKNQKLGNFWRLWKIILERKKNVSDKDGHRNVSDNWNASGGQSRKFWWNLSDSMEPNQIFNDPPTKFFGNSNNHLIERMAKFRSQFYMLQENTVDDAYVDSGSKHHFFHRQNMLTKYENISTEKVSVAHGC